MRLSRRTSLARVAAHVADTLARSGIRAVLTGGACAAIYSRGSFQSFDVDFVLQSAATPKQLDQVMRSIGFRRRGSHYTHPETSFLVEFPAGPLGLGADLRIRPVELRVGRTRLLALSATDSCRDRLASFYHWNDRQSLAAAVAIARRHEVNLPAIRKWSRAEGAMAGFREFLGLLDSRRAPAPRSANLPRKRRSR